jgi:NAD(P)-dependent dehydrogenase (short-subunit alcohol dehydrogenase family)
VFWRFSAGIQRRGTVLEFEREWLEDLFTVNCTSQFVLARDFARHRAKQLKAHPELGANTSFGRNNGKIVWVASNSSFSGGFLISG